MKTPRTQDCLQWIELSQSALTHNVQSIRNHCRPETHLAAMLKANAYGHGLLPMATCFQKAGVNTFMVHSFSEADTLYQAGFRKRIIVIGPLAPKETEASVSRGIEFVCYNPETLQHLHSWLGSTNRKARIHIKIETGTHRQGILIKDLPAIIRRLKGIPGIKVQGICSHFANIEDTSDTRYFRTQLRRFQKAIGILEQAGIHAAEHHMSCSAAILLYPETQGEMIRPGIGVYGYYPSPEIAYTLKESELQPVLSWKTRMGQIKSIPKGSPVGYGCTHVTTRKTRLGVLPIGYYDGFDRKLSNIGYVLVHGRRAKVLGRVCMNLTMVDLTDIPHVQLGDRVTLIGRDGEELLTADHLAQMTQTINYEILARLNPLIPRVVVS